MDFNEYQKLATKSANYPMMGNNMVYPAMGLAGEAGETADKIKKHWRNYADTTTYSMSSKSLTSQQRDDIIKELGDVLWYAAALSNELGVTLEQVAETNIAKLESRHNRGTILGEGDNR